MNKVSRVVCRKLGSQFSTIRKLQGDYSIIDHTYDVVVVGAGGLV